MNSTSPVDGSDGSPWTVIDNPNTAGFSVDGIRDGWARADHLHIDGLPATAWFSKPLQKNGFTPNAVLAARTARITRRHLDELLSALCVPDSAGGLILMDPPVVLTNTADAYAQRADAVVQSPFGPLSSRVWHSVRRERGGDRVSMGRLTVTVARTEARLLEGFDLRH